MSATPFTVEDPWKAEGLCRTPAAAGVDFFPKKPNPVAPAKAVCAQCPVTAECLDYALANGERFGVWGGLSERQRKGIRAARRQERIAS